MKTLIQYDLNWNIVTETPIHKHIFIDYIIQKGMMQKCKSCGEENYIRFKRSRW